LKRLLFVLIVFVLMLSGTAGAALIEGPNYDYGPGSWSQDFTVYPSAVTMTGDSGWQTLGLSVSTTLIANLPPDSSYMYQTYRTIKSGTTTFDFFDGVSTNTYTLSGTSTTDYNIRLSYDTGSASWIYAGIRDGSNQPVPFVSVMTGLITDENLNTFNIVFTLEQDEDTYSLNPTTNQLESQAGSVISSSMAISSVPVPAAIWLFGSGLIGLVGIRRRMNT